MSRRHIKEAEILRLMADGWEMGLSIAFDGGCWLQKGKVGHGGETRPVHAATFGSMHRRGLIKSTGYRFPTTVYRLAERE